MASGKAYEAHEKYLSYAEFRKEFDKLDEADRKVVQPYLDKLLKDWTKAIHQRHMESQKRREI